MIIKPHEIPESWVFTTMGEISTVIGGGTPKTKEADNYEGGNIPWLTPADLSGYTGKKIGHGSRFITEKGLATSSARMMPEGTVLYTSRAPIGYVAIASNPICTNQDFKSFVLNDGILPDYVYWYLKGTKDLAESLASGTTFLELSGARAKQIPIPIAPLNEQKRIVAEIEKQFSRLDEAVDNLKRVKANLKRYKASVLKAAVEGKLTEERRAKNKHVEPADKLLERILAERRKKWEEAELARLRERADRRQAKMKAKGKEPKDDKWKSKYKVPEGPDIVSFSLPSGWKVATVKQLAERVQYGSSSKTNEDASGVPVLRMGNIFEGELLLDELKYLPEDHEEFPRLLLDENDLLSNRTNSPELVGKTAVYAGKPKPCSFASYLIRVRVLSGLEPRYISYYINSAYGRQWIKSVVSQQVGQSNVNGTKLQALTVPLPPTEEQVAIVSEVENRFSVIGGVERDVDANLARAERLRQSILKRAFAGKLTPQSIDLSMVSISPEAEGA